MLRFVIAIVATIELAYFYTDMPFSFRKMISLDAAWFNILTGWAMAVAAPLMVVAALGLAAIGRRPGIAAILLGMAPPVYWSPFLAFFAAIMIKGF